MSFQKVTEDVTCYKPRMKAAKTIDELPSIEGQRNVTAQVKADGEFNYIKYSREGETFLLNRFGRKTVGLPCLEEFKKLMSRVNVVEAEVLGELYAVGNDGKMLTLPNLIHYLKGGDRKLHQYIKIGLFELVSINGVKCNLIYPRKFETMELWTEGGELVNVLDYFEVSTLIELQSLWRQKVVDGTWEGLIVRVNGGTWKVKPNNGVDVAIIGVNKDNKGFSEGKAKSLKMGLMNEDGTFVEIGDCSGVGEAEASELFKLTEMKIGEDNNTVFVQPVVIATVEYITTYPETRNKRFKIEGNKIKELGEQTLVKLRNPHIIGYRADKKACIEDISLSQLPDVLDMKTGQAIFLKA